MTAEEYAAILAEQMEPVTDWLEHMAQVQYGIFVAIGFVAGLLVAYLLLHKF